MFVRLREDRRSVDVVAVMDEGGASQSLAQREVDSIAQLLGKDFSGASARMQLCPMCCSADMFVRSGAAHVFHVQEVAACAALTSLHCSRYHDVTASDVTHGKLTKLDMDALPLVYPSRFHELQLPWKRVASGGIISCTAVASKLSVDTMVELAAGQPGDGSCSDATAAPPRLADVALPLSAASLPQSTHVLATDSAPASSPPSAHDAFRDGVFTDVSFFVLTGQVSAGDSVSAADAPEFTRLLSVCASQDCSCDIQLSSGQRKSLTFSFTVGQCLPNPFVGGLPIHSIFPADVGDRALQAQVPLLQRFCAHDNVLVVFGPIVSNPKPKFLVFPGSSANLQLCRLTPALCQNDLTAACCWSELQDQFSVVMGQEFEMYEITALTLMRNDARAARFTANVQRLEQQAPLLPATPHWCKTPSDVVGCPCPQQMRTCSNGCAGCSCHGGAGGVQGRYRERWYRRCAACRHERVRVGAAG